MEDVNDVFLEHKKYLDDLWPETGERLRKDEILDIIDGMKSRLAQRAHHNLNRSDNAFEAAARRATGTEKKVDEDTKEKHYETRAERISRIKKMNGEGGE